MSGSARCLAGVLIACVQIAAAQGLPQSPQVPTTADCNQLQQQLHVLSTAALRESSACMKTRPVIGYALSCKGARVYRAWPQCQPLDCEADRLNEYRYREVALCRNRVREIESRQDQEMRERAETARKLYERSNDVVGFLRNPSEFLKEAVSSKMYETLFSSDVKLRQNKTAAEEVYGLAWDVAHDGFVSYNQYRSPIIRGIQGVALDRLNGLMTTSLRNMDQVATDIARFGNEELAAAGQKAAPPPLPSTMNARVAPAPAETRAESSDCKFARGVMKQYLDNCQGSDGCTNRGRMEASVADACR